jgi:hypothetical protein
LAQKLRFVAPEKCDAGGLSKSRLGVWDLIVARTVISDASTLARGIRNDTTRERRIA